MIQATFFLQIAGLIAEDDLMKVPNKNTDFADIFILDLASKFSKQTGINNYAIELENANKFIKLSKSSTDLPIFFDRMLDGSLWLCVNYRDINNLTIKNWYLLSLVGELLDRLGKARRFT